MSCDNHCPKPAAFPLAIFNRPALPRINYRIGAYGEMRAHMLGLIDRAPALAAWTHRGSDDPGIALVEGMAVVGDILSLYQDNYANEAYLRTATLDSSVTGLVRLLGYRPAPGLGGHARFALAVKGAQPVTVPAGLALDATLEGTSKPATFETRTEITAVPALSEFHLHRPRRVPPIVNGMKVFQLGAADGVTLKPGDKLMVGLALGPSDNAAYGSTQVMEVEKVWEAYGLRYVQTKGQMEALQPVQPLQPVLSLQTPQTLQAFQTFATLQPAQTVQPGQILQGPPGLQTGLGFLSPSSTPRLVAWKLGGLFQHFGHATPPSRLVVDAATGRATQQAVPFGRVLDASHSADASSPIAARQLPLEGALKDIAPGISVLVVAKLGTSPRAIPRQRVLLRRVQQVDAASMSWGAQSGPATVLGLDQHLAITESGLQLRHTDIRSMTVHAVQGEAFELRAAPVNTSATSGVTLDFYVTAADAQALLARTLLMREPTGPATAQVQRVRRQASGEPRFELTLDRSVSYALYPHDHPLVPVHGNLVEASEGKHQPDTALGDGDARATFQTFALPKAPLTYLLDPTATPPQRPEIEVRVNGLLWQRVESFYDSGPRDLHYIVRQAEDGSSLVQFGDGVTGARLPSGKGNVVATYRSGSGSRGPLKPDTSVSAKPRFAGFDQAYLHEPVTGGAAPEPATSVRLAAPATMHSLGRIVSLSDCESEAQSLPGVLKARASWALVDGASVLMLTVLTDGLASADRQALEGALRSAFAARGPARFALQLRLGNRLFADVALRVGYSAALRTADLLPALHAALGTSPDELALDDLPTGGLFDWRQRQFGQDVHGSQVVGRVQNVPGVAWVALQRLAPRDARRLPATLAAGPGPELAALSPVALPATQRRLACPGHSLLALHAENLAIEWVPVA
jgi:predicted phage baseplate assembly protein